MFWTEAKITELTKHWGAGLSASECAAMMHISRNAVIGKVTRLGLGRTATPVSEEERKRKEKVRDAKRATAQRLRRQKIRGEKSKMQAETIPAPAFVGSLSVPFGELRSFTSTAANQCRYIAAEPAGPDYLACGNETLPGESWCGHCKSIVYTKPLPISDQERARRSSHATRNWNAAAVKATGPSEVMI